MYLFNYLYAFWLFYVYIFQTIRLFPGEIEQLSKHIRHLDCSHEVAGSYYYIHCNLFFYARISFN